MAFAFVNTVQNSTDSTPANTGTSPAIAVTAGNLIIVAFQHANGIAALGVTLSDGVNTYTDKFAAELWDGGENRLRVFSAIALTTASITITATIGSSANSGYRAFLIDQYSGIASDTMDGGQLLLVTSPGTGTDGISTSGTNTGQPRLAWSIALNDSTANPPTAGTGETSRGTFWDYTGTNGASTLCRHEDKRVTSSGPQVGTFTALDGSSVYRTAFAMFPESGGGGGGSGLINLDASGGGTISMSGGMMCADRDIVDPKAPRIFIPGMTRRAPRHPTLSLR